MTQWGIDTLFNPAKRHMDEEKRRLQSTREEIGDASGGKRIDLESGKVVIARADAADEADADGADSAPQTKRAKKDRPKAKSEDGDRDEPSAAAVRAARRRGREPR